MQKTLFTKLTIIVGLCIIFVVGLMMFRTVIAERQYYAQSVVKEIAQQHVNPQEVITPFIIIPTTITPECSIVGDTDAAKCKSAYSSTLTVFANKTSATQDLEVSTDTYRRGIYHATSYNGALKFDQSYTINQTLQRLIADNQSVSNDSKTLSTANNSTNGNGNTKTEKTDIHWNDAKFIIPVSDLRGVATLPTVTIDKQAIKATYPQSAMLNGLSYVEVSLPNDVLNRLTTTSASQQEKTNLVAENLNSEPLNTQSSNIQTPISQNPNHQDLDGQQSDNSRHQALDIVVDLPLSGISTLNTVPTGQNFELSMRSNWHAPNFIGRALPNAKTFTSKGFEAKWQNQYLTVANNQNLSKCVSTANNQCMVASSAVLDSADQDDEAITAIEGIVTAEGNIVSNSDRDVRLSSFGVSFAEPNDVYLQTERTMKYALLLILVSFGTFFLFEVIKSSRIHPIQYLLVGCALLCFYVLLLPLAEQIVFWQAYMVAASACVGLIGWYSYYVFGGFKRAVIFTATLAGLYAAFFGILSTEDLNLLLGAIFCFVILACVMVMTRKLDWYKVT
tara:strand:+ start:904 stop:2589 length:1686 start_codon:yes stop_codon:yes gene_type:complete